MVKFNYINDQAEGCLNSVIIIVLFKSNKSGIKLNIRLLQEKKSNNLANNYNGFKYSHIDKNEHCVFPNNVAFCYRVLIQNETFSITTNDFPIKGIILNISLKKSERSWSILLIDDDNDV